jgi:hypothetical protein
MKICRYPDCKKPQHRFQLCNKHRKWVERGYMTEDLKILKPIREVGRNTVCTIDGCRELAHKARLCMSHYGKVLRGTMTRTGEVTRKKMVDKYARDFQCIVCGKATGRIVKGFCMSHYNHYRKGYIDFDGVKMREPKKVAKYGPLDYCKIKQCGKRPVAKGLCRSHRDMVLRGTLNPETGKRRYIPSENKGKSCKECDQPAVIRLLCPLHYYRKYQAHPREFKNSGKSCTAFGCSSPAYARTLCVKHYSRRKRKEQILRAASEFVQTTDTQPLLSAPAHQEVSCSDTSL